MGEEQNRPDQLTPVQQVILDNVRGDPGRFTRSSLAKLLVGSKSSRLGELVEHPDFGRLGQYGRKEISNQIEILMQQGFLDENSQSRLVPKANSSE